MGELLKKEELAKIAAAAAALRAIVHQNAPGRADQLSAQLERLHELLNNNDTDTNRAIEREVSELTYRLNEATDLLDWAYVFEEADAVIDWLSLALAEQRPQRPRSADDTPTELIRLPRHIVPLSAIPEYIQATEDNRKPRHFAYSFRSDLSLAGMLCRMNEQGPYRWKTVHHPERNQYLLGRAPIYAATLRLFAEVHEAGYYLVSVLQQISLPGPVEGMAQLRDVLTRRILPAIGARDVVRSLMPPVD